jgi:hypothetical protein
MTLEADDDLAFLAAAGALASGVSAELCPPLREIRDALAVVVETLDRHFAEARGPAPYPWAETKALRERLAETYLLSRTVNRLTNDLARAVSARRGAPDAVDVNKLVEEAIALARHRIGEDSDLAVDLGHLPAVRIVEGDLVLLMARLLGLAAEAARTAGGGTVGVRTRRERAEQQPDLVVVEIAVEGVAAGTGDPVLPALARRALEPAGGELREAGAGFQIALPVAR